jgi:para-nitrobenzyl esterase
MKNAGINRRALIKSAGTLAGATAISGFLPAAASASPRAEAPKSSKGPGATIASDQQAVVETSAGKVRGYIHNGIFTFKGMPYGESPAGKGRFAPPTKAKPWTGLRSSMHYGHLAPQPVRTSWGDDEVAFVYDWDDGLQGEDCLCVNVWSPGVNDNRKRPVMVYLHGGGFYFGSSQELPSLDGENLSRRGGVVVASINHRLGILGYLNLADYGADYASSSNVGMLDIVLALQWVQENIGNFGGDPGNVTIFGQSGGGGKVNTLMAMPSAKGLFHRAITQSGSMLRARTPEKSSELTAAVLKELGLNGSQVSQLNDIPFAKLVEVGVEVTRRPPSGPPDVRRMAETLGWGPVMDGKVLPQHPFDPTAPAISAQVPLMVGTVLNEFLTATGHPEYEAMTYEEVGKRVHDAYGDQSEQIVQVFRKAHPGEKPFDILSLIMAARVRQGAVTQAERKAAQGAAPAYLYWFTRQSPVLDGRVMAIHCAELPFCFNNIARCGGMSGGGPEAQKLADQVSDAWINFARKGNPNHGGLPNWPAFTAEKCPTMLFDTPCAMKENPDTEERKAIAAT